MAKDKDIILESFAALSVAKCLQRMSRASTGTWQVRGAKVSYGSIRDALKQHDFSRPAAAVYLSLEGASPLTSAMFFSLADTPCVSQCFTGQSFHRGERTTPAEEMMLVELGNIVLNALMNAVLNALRRRHMPLIPRFVEGGLDALEAEFRRLPGLAQDFRIVTVGIEMTGGKCSARSEVAMLLPEEMALELETAGASAGSHDGIQP